MNLLRANNDEGVRGVESESQHPRAIRRLYAGSPGAASQYCVNLCPDESDTETIICEAMNNISEPIRQRLPARNTAVIEVAEQPTGVPFHMLSFDSADASFRLLDNSRKLIAYLRPVPFVPMKAKLCPNAQAVRQILAGTPLSCRVFEFVGCWYVDAAGQRYQVQLNGLPLSGDVYELDRPQPQPQSIVHTEALVLAPPHVVSLARWNGCALELFRVREPRAALEIAKLVYLGSGAS